MMHWNVTYNDPNRWKEVYAVGGARLPWWSGIRETLQGLPVGSPKLDLIEVQGIEALQALREALSERTQVNFLRTSAGLIAFTKVRLEVYAVPMCWSEELTCTKEGALIVHFERNGQPVALHMKASASAEAKFRMWFERARR